MRNVYILAGAYSDAPGASPGERPRRVFRSAVDFPDRRPPPLETGLFSAAENALAATTLDEATRRGPGIRERVTNLVVTTMPDVWPEEMSLGLYATRLKNRLRLAPACQSRFEVGSSDAGASAFASTVQLLRGDEAPRTALVLAGQAMPHGSEAIRAISRVLDPIDRAAHLNMLNIGDLVLDAFLRGWGLDAAARRLWPGGGAQMVAELTAHKLALSRGYPSACRSGEAPEDRAAWFTPLMRQGDIAPATNGACAVLLTTDRELTQAWVASSGARRVVRVLGVGEGEAATAVARRPEPFFYAHAVHQALALLCRDARVNLDFLRAGAFAVLHDAFPSIEIAFMAALGFDPFATAQRLLTWWPNPYGGLTAFGHCLGASGLVQVAKAFHVFTRPDAWFEHPAGAVAGEPDFTELSGPMHCLTTSVGGPLTHVVATLLQSVPLDADSTDLPTRFTPAERHRLRSALEGEQERQAAWVARLDAEWLAGIAAVHPGPFGVLEARSRLHLSALPLPLPDAMRGAWRPGPVRVRDASVELPDELAREWADRLPTRDDLPEGAALLLRHVERECPALHARLSRAADGGVGELYAAIQADVGPHVGLYRTHGPGDTPERGLCLLSDAVAGALPGEVLELVGGGPLPVALRLARGAGLRPPWMREPVGPERPMEPDPPVRVAIQELARRLLVEEVGTGLLDAARLVANRVAAACQAEVDRAPPPAAVRMFRRLAFSPEPDPRALAQDLEALLGSGNPVVHEKRAMGYVEFDVVGSGRLRTEDDAATLDIVARAIRTSEGWLCGTGITHSRRADAFTVSVQDPYIARQPTATTTALLRFARDVYQVCLDAGVPVRAVVWIGEGFPFHEVAGHFAVASIGQRAARRVLREAPEFHAPGGTMPGERPEHGVAVVCPRHVILPGDDGAAKARDYFEGAWRPVGGERFTTVREVGTIELASGGSVFYQVRARRD